MSTLTAPPLRNKQRPNELERAQEEQQTVEPEATPLRSPLDNPAGNRCEEEEEEDDEDEDEDEEDDEEEEGEEEAKSMKQGLEMKCEEEENGQLDTMTAQLSSKLRSSRFASRSISLNSKNQIKTKQVAATTTNQQNNQAHKQHFSSSTSSTSTTISAASASKLIDSQQMHVCRLCDKLLSSSSSLDRHMLTHSGERPFVCKRCHMTFTTNGNMHRHMRTHLHKDSLARQQEEQQMKCLVGASLSASSLSPNPNKPDLNQLNLNYQTRHQLQQLQQHQHHNQPQSAIKSRQTELLLSHSTTANSSANSPLPAPFSPLSIPQLPVLSALPAPAIPTMAPESPATKFLCNQQLDLKALMMNALQGDQLGLESVKAVMLAAAAAAAAVSQQQQQQQHHSQLLDQQRHLTVDREPNSLQRSDCKEEEDCEEDNSQLQRFRSGKRRKQVNPRSTRSHQVPASLNSDDSDDRSMDLLISKRQSGRLSERQETDDWPSSANSEVAVDEQDRGNHDNNNSNDSGAQFKRIESAEVSIKQEDFNNNQDEEANINALQKDIKREKSRNVEQESNSDEEEEDDDEDDNMSRMNMSLDSDEDEEASLDSDVNMNNLSDNNNSSQMQLAHFDSSHTTDINETDELDQASTKTQLGSSNNNNNFQSSAALNHHKQLHHHHHSSPQQTLPNPWTTVNGEIIEDISQSYVKTANPNAARKGGKRNRHCYKCKLCTYSSVDRCTLVRHLRIHSGERPYICGICRYAFTTKANCERHVRKRHKKQYNSLGGAGGGGVKGSNGGGRSLIITDHSNHQTIPAKVNPVAAQTISQTLQRLQEKQQQQQNSTGDDEIGNIERISSSNHQTRQLHQHHSQHLQQQVQVQNLVDTRTTTTTNNNVDTTSLGGYKNKRKHPNDETLDQALDLSCKFLYYQY